MNAKEYVHILLDGSGSMTELWEEAVEALNHELEIQHKRKMESSIPEITVGFTVFNDKVVMQKTFGMADDKPVLEPSFWQPHGYSAIYDAIGDALRGLRQDWQGPIGSHPSKILLKVICSGADNASTRWTSTGVQSEILEMKEQGDFAIQFLAEDFEEVEAQGLVSLRRRHGYSEWAAFRKEVMFMLLTELRDGQLSVSVPDVQKNNKSKRNVNTKNNKL
jgi:hypothetical protein